MRIQDMLRCFFFVVHVCFVLLYANFGSLFFVCKWFRKMCMQMRRFLCDTKFRVDIHLRLKFQSQLDNRTTVFSSSCSSSFISRSYSLRLTMSLRKRLSVFIHLQIELCRNVWKNEIKKIINWTATNTRRIFFHFITIIWKYPTILFNYDNLSVGLTNFFVLIAPKMIFLRRYDIENIERTTQWKTVSHTHTRTPNTKHWTFIN